ncbi:MAG TPA: PEP/pyruvate-binding domain-containing protein, partial [Candidatus Saccharimonadales bacterium]|nr:PEP/pyruvate-binding domain-containing protein [Candidatus Saccharimonadales bacterium]
MRALAVPFLGEPASHDAERVGAKAATLGRLAARYRVPAGFCIDSQVFERFTSAQDGDTAAHEGLRRIIDDSLRALEQRVGRPDLVLAVRSSAIGEDGGGSSFAGQHETILGARGAEEITRAVIACWRSAGSERARAYRRERGVSDAVCMPVLVQELVDAESAAIAFTVDPVTGDSAVVVVNAAWGLGESLASGSVTPDTHVVRKDGLVLTSSQIAEKAVMTVRATGGTTEVAVPPGRRSLAALTDAQVIAVASLSLELEAESGGPVDVECAYAGGDLYLLQSRPITAVGAAGEDFPVEWDDPADAALTWDREDAHFGEFQLPLATDYVVEGPSFGIRRRSELMAAPVLGIFKAFNGRMYAALKTLVPPDEVAAAAAAVLVRRRAHARGLARLWDEEYLPKVRADLDWMRSLRPADLDPSAAARAWGDLWRRVNHIWVIHMMVTSGAYGIMDELAEVYEALTGRPGVEALSFTSGRAATLQGQQRDFHRLLERIRDLPAVATAVAAGTVRTRAAITALPGGATAAAALDEFLAVHGDVGQLLNDLHVPAWADDPSLLLTELARSLAGDISDDPEARLAGQRAGAEAATERTRAMLAGRPNDLARFDEVLATALAAGPLTEEHNYWIDRNAQAVTRRAVLAFGARLVRDGQLATDDDIFLFHHPEVRDALASGEDLRPRAAERERQVRRQATLRAPLTLGAPRDASASPGNARVDLGYRLDQPDAPELRAVPASAGIGRGPARLIHDEKDFARFRRGDVLVCRSSNVSWVPLFRLAAAVVTDVGGSLSHAAVVAREFGVPAVVGAGVALTVLRDGELLEVDGTA